MTFLTKTLATVAAATVLLAGGASTAVATSNSDEWFYFFTQPSNLVTWGGFSGTTGSFLGEGFCVDPIVSVNSLTIDRDPVSETLYFVGASGVFTVDYVADRCTLSELLPTSDFPATLVSFRGISLNAASTALEVLWYNGDSAEYESSTVNIADGSISRTLALDSTNLIYTDAMAMTRIGDVIYIASSENQLWAFDAVSGDEDWVAGGPSGAGSAIALDRSSDGLIQLVTVRTRDGKIGFSTFDPAASSWSTVVPTNYPRGGYTYIDVDSDNLANTGVDPTGLVLAAGSLLALGAIVARRRARR
jgi:hypothetical protein